MLGHLFHLRPLKSTMNTDTFESSRLKIQRAYRHINELQTLFNTFLQSAFYKIHIEEEAGSGQFIVKILSIAEPPAETALIVGDICHNLASALDHAIARIFPRESEWLKFPNGVKRDDLIASRHYGFDTKSHAQSR